MNAISSALAGIEQAQTQLASTAGRLSKAALPDGSGGDSVDLSSEIVSLLAARNAVGVRVAIAHTVEDSDKRSIYL